MPAKASPALVLDASVVVKWHLTDEEFNDEATAILKDFAQGDVELLAPEQIRYEVPSAITMATLGRKPRISVDQGREAIGEFLGLGVKTVADNDLILAAYSLVHRYGCALYDALYVALGQRLGVQFITADRKLYRLIRELPDVLWIGDCKISVKI